MKTTKEERDALRRDIATWYYTANERVLALLDDADECERLAVNLEGRLTEIRTIVHVLGGEVEGLPTQTINYLQRIRELRRIEEVANTQWSRLAMLAVTLQLRPSPDPKSENVDGLARRIRDHIQDKLGPSRPFAERYDDVVADRDDWRDRAEAAERERDEAQRVLVEWADVEATWLRDSREANAKALGGCTMTALEKGRALAADPEVRRRIERKEGE